MLFLTGMPRCGSTWAGHALAQLTGCRYVHEPLNGHRHPQWAWLNMRYYRRGACDASVLKALKRSARAPMYGARLRELMSGRRRVVLKEVHATLAVACVDRHVTRDIVIVTRHPCAVAASWKRLGWLAEPWRADDRLLRQDPLVEDHLAPFRDHILSTREPFFRLGAYWGAIYYVLKRLAAAHPRWCWVSHEDLCDAPLERFTTVLRALGWKTRADAGDFIERHDRPARGGEGPYDIFRDRRTEPFKWRKLLGADEARAVERGAEPFGVDVLLTSRIAAPA